MLGAGQTHALIVSPTNAPQTLPPVAPLEATPDTANLRVLRDCLTSLPEDSRARPTDRCPRVADAIRRLGLSDSLGPDWEKRLTRGSLQDLVQLAQRYVGTPLSAAPAAATLAPILRQLRADATTHSWWEDFKARLRRLLEPPDPGDGSWLAQLLSAIPRRAQRLFVYVTTAAIVVWALWMLWKELLAGVVLGRGRGGAAESARAAAVADAADAVARELTLSDLEAAPAAQRAGLLLRLLLQAMRRSGRVRDDRPLTCRELGAHAVFDDAEQRRRFVSLALWAERERYGVEANALSSGALLEQGRQLYGELGTASLGTASLARRALGQPTGAA